MAVKMRKIILLLFCLAVIFECAYANSYEIRIKEISDGIVKGCTAFDEKVLALRRYVHNKMQFPKGRKKPNGGSITPWDIYPLNTIERLNSGLGGWCDQQADVFMHLAQKQGIDTKMLFLYVKEGEESRHTIAIALSPDNRWVIVDLDPSYDLELFNKDGKLASREDVRNDKSILYENLTIKELIAKDSSMWTDEYLSMFYNNLARVFKQRMG
jgi:hypothetical protein